MPGVVAIFTGKDMADASRRPDLRLGGQGQARPAAQGAAASGDGARHGALCRRHGGHGRRRQPRRGARTPPRRSRSTTTCSPPTSISPRRSTRARPQVHAEAPGNLIYDWEIGVKADVDAAFAKAAHVTKLDLVNNRLVPNAMEPRAAAASYDKGTGDYTLWSTSQNPHVLRLLMSAFVLGIPEHKLRVIAPDVGGGFGSKIFCYNEETMVHLGGDAESAGRSSGPPSAASRSMTDAHGRDHVTHAELALDKDGKFLGLQGRRPSPTWAPTSRPSRPAVPTYLYATLLAGQYTTPADPRQRAGGVFTNTAPVDAYRGAGRPEATYVLERMVSKAAARAEDGSGRAAPEELHPDDRLPVPDAGGAAVRQRQLPADHRRGAQDRRLQGLRGAPRRGQVARQAARHRLLVLHRGLRPRAVAGGRPARRRRRPVGVGAGQVQPDRQRPGLDRLAQPRPGPRDDLRPDRVATSSACRSSRSRSSTATPATTPFGMGTYGSALAGGRRLGHREGGRQDHRQGQEDRGPSAGGVGRRHRVRAAAPSRSPAPTRPCRSAQAVFAAYVPHNYPRGARARPGGERLLRSVELRLSRPARTSARSRSTPTPARSRSSTTPRSTTSATSSIR